MARSIFETSTFKSARIAMIAGAAVTIINVLSPVLIDFFPMQAKNISQAIALVNTVAGLFGIGGGAGAVLGRANADAPVESPAWMPGPNRGELAEQQVKEDKLDQVLNTVSAVAAVAGAFNPMHAIPQAAHMVAGSVNMPTRDEINAGTDGVGRIIPDEVI